MIKFLQKPFVFCDFFIYVVVVFGIDFGRVEFRVDDIATKISFSYRSLVEQIQKVEVDEIGFFNFFSAVSRSANH